MVPVCRTPVGKIWHAFNERPLVNSNRRIGRITEKAPEKLMACASSGECTAGARSGSSNLGQLLDDSFALFREVDDADISRSGCIFDPRCDELFPAPIAEFSRTKRRIPFRIGELRQYQTVLHDRSWRIWCTSPDDRMTAVAGMGCGANDWG